MALFNLNRHNPDTKSDLIKLYSKLKLVKTTNDTWFIQFNYVVPEPLRKNNNLYPRSTKRFKIYKGINSLEEPERSQYAEELLETVEYALKSGAYNPFQNKFEALSQVDAITKKITLSKILTEEDRRKTTHVGMALDLFLASRRTRKVESKTQYAYERTVKCLKDGLPDLPINDIRYMHVSSAIDNALENTTWSPGTINAQWENANILFGWLETEDYVSKNPLKGKIVKLSDSNTIHKWYDKETAMVVKEVLKKKMWLYRVCQFNYWTLIRSKKELQSLKVGDINFDLQQIMFRKEWTKNSSDQNREYGYEFAKVIEEMGLRNLPKHYYIFGSGGMPGETRCGHNTFSEAWRVIRNKLNLSEDYTIYGWKHTRIVHMMMMGKSSYEIAHAARHSDSKTTEAYKRDYDITVNQVYDEKDLTF
jgi:hypothetical protein